MLGVGAHPTLGPWKEHTALTAPTPEAPQDPTLSYLRLTIGDTSTTPDEQLFTDEQLCMFLANEPSPLFAAAAALDVIAVDVNLLMRKIRTQDLQTDGPAVAAELRAQAKQLRGRKAEENTAAVDDFGLAIINYNTGTIAAVPELTEYPYPTPWTA